jgi:ADP-heptose:LPS heptosyltransferase
LLEGHDAVDNVISVGKSASERLKVALQLRRQNYDVAFNLHGGTTATFFTAASRAKHRVGFADYQYSFLYNHLLSSASDFWQTELTHSAEQQLALLGFVGVPVDDRPKTRLVVSPEAATRVRTACVGGRNEQGDFALIHPASAFATKQWPTENFAKTAEFLAAKGLQTVGVASRKENDVLEQLKKLSTVPITTFNDLSLPEITALASQAKVFIGNDSGIAHIAAAVGTPSVVVFGSSNRNHWRPWTHAPNEIVLKEFACQPCPGYRCEVFGQPRCILEVEQSAVFTALQRVLSLSDS